VVPEAPMLVWVLMPMLELEVMLVSVLVWVLEQMLELVLESVSPEVLRSVEMWEEM
jgi:hypothetical protein